MNSINQGWVKFANGAVTAAMAYAFNQLATHEEKFRRNRSISGLVSVEQEEGLTRIGISATVGGVSKFQAETFISQVGEFWQGTFTAPGGHVFELSLDLTYDGFNPDIIITAHRNMPERSGDLAFRSHAELGGRRVGWWVYDNPVAAAHEFGHILGFGDTYNPSSGLPLPGHQNDIMGSLQGRVQWYHAKILSERYSR